MEEQRSGSRRGVILAVDQSAAPLAAKLAMLISVDSCLATTTHIPRNPGDALRFLHRHGATILLICVTSENLRLSSAVISAVRDRLPGLPILALAAEHDSSLERSLREAGAAFYFTISADAREILSTIETLSASRPLAYDDPVPARARGRPPARLNFR